MLILRIKMLQQPPDKLYTKYLKMRKPEKEDATTIYELYSQDEEVTRFLTWQPHRSIKETRKFLTRCEKSWKEGIAFPWAIIRKTDNQLLGMIEIISVDHSGISIGYVLARPFWGNGYMAEALKSVIDWALKQKDIYRVWSVCDVENLASARVMEKAGMQKEGVLRRWVRLSYFGEKPRDCFCYSIVK